MTEMTGQSSEPLIMLDGVNKWFGSLHVLRDVDLTVDRGEVVVVIGPSGSGKSTLCRSINLFAHKTILQNVTLGPIKVRREKPAAARERGMALLQRVGIADQAAKYPAQLSGGQQQRAAIARALAMQPKAML